MIVAAPTYRAFAPHELPVAGLPPSADGCALCGEDVDVDHQYQLCADCWRVDHFDYLDRQDRLRQQTAESWASVIRQGVCWLGGAALFCAALFAFVPTLPNVRF